MIASQARLKSKLTEKAATLPSATMRRKQVSGSTEAQELPRLRDYASGTDRLALWQRDVRKSAGGFSKGKRAQGTSDEHSLLYSLASWTSEEPPLSGMIPC